MAAQSIFHRLCSLRRLCLNEAFIRSKVSFLNTRTTFPALHPPALYCCGKRRTFSSDGGQNPGERNVKRANFIITQGPFGWLSKTVNLWFLKTFIDREFEEREFLRGAKQALCVVSEKLVSGKWAEMEGILSETLTEAIRDRMDPRKLGSAVTMEEILSANIQKLRFGFVENGKGKVVDIQVAYMCKSSENENQLFEREMGNVKIIGIPVPKITYYTFRKIIFSESASDWQVESITPL